MDFGVFSKEDMEQMYHEIENNMSDGQKEIFIKEYGSMEEFKKQFLDHSSCEEAQKNFAKMVEWHGSKDSAKAAATNPGNAKIAEAYGKRLDQVIKKLAAKVGADMNAFEVKEIVGEMNIVSKQLYQMEDITAFMLDMAEKYVRDTRLQERLDAV